jgi:membrane protein
MDGNQQSQATAPQSATDNLNASTLPAPLQTLACRAPALARAIQFCWRFGERWGLDQCSLIAAAMAFFGLLSVFPILLAGIAILGRVLADRPEAVAQFVGFVANFFPGSTGAVWQERIEAEISNLAQSNGVTISLISMASLLWTGRAFFDTLAAVLNSIWPHAQPRSWLQHQVALWSTFVGAALFYGLSLVASFALNLLHTLSVRFDVPLLNDVPVLWDVGAIFLSWLLTLLMFWLIYRFLPNATRGGRNRAALASALIATVLLEVAEYLFARYAPTAARYGAVYGSVAGVVLTLMWLYVSSSIILVGAEAAAAYAEIDALAHGEPKPTQDKVEDKAESLGATMENDPPVKHG